MPATEADIDLAISEGSLVENGSLDMKRESGSTSGERAETARDLASFAIFGGALLIGVGERKSPKTGEDRFSLDPQPLEGLSEKLEQIAANRIDPPLFIRVSEIASADDPTVGYLFVEIPPSATAPHMVEGRYYARGEKTKRRLTDAEVVALHEQRRSRGSIALEILRDEVERDPWGDRHDHGHLYVVAEPLQAAKGLMRTHVRNGNGAISAILVAVENRFQHDAHATMPTPLVASSYARRARGLAASTFPGGARRREPGFDEGDALDIEFTEDGGIRLFCGRLTIDSRQDDYRQMLLDSLVAAYAWRVVSWAGEIARLTGYRGAWGFGLAGKRLEGSESSRMKNDFGQRSYPYDRDEYEESTTATFAEIEDAPGAVAERLAGYLLRGVGTSSFYEELLS